MAMFSFTQFQILMALWTVKVKWGPYGVPRQERVNHCHLILIPKNEPRPPTMKMKFPRALIAAAASKVSTKLGKPPAAALNTNKNLVPKPQLSRRLQRHLTDAANDHHYDRFLEETQAVGDPVDSTTCDASFLRCILSPTCRGCFETLQENDIDWANVVPETPCQDVLGFLVGAGHCHEVHDGGTEEQDTFCSAFDSCVEWDDEVKKEGDPLGKKESTDEMDIDCANLTECAFPGMHEHFLGDGVCHDAMPGCYNSKVCGYDGGDCCEDTCHYPGQKPDGDDYGDCGSEGWACRDPSSINCQPALARLYKEFCPLEEEEIEDGSGSLFDDDEFKEDILLPSCESSDSIYRLVQFDSWGDGWDNTVLTLSENGNDTPLYKGGLQYGSQGTVHLCLTKKEAKCYHVTVENGVWGNEISWELRPLSGGAPVLAAGGSPSDCTVPLGGAPDDCPKTCDAARPDTKIDDPNYKSYKEMEGCIEQKCLIQVGNCAQDTSCSECMQESSPDYCFANENFNVLIDCSMCSCTENRPQYCDAKSSGAAASSTSGSSAATHEGNVKPATGSGSATAGSATGGMAVCGPEQTLKGTSSLVKFSQCADIDQLMAMVTEFDNDNFGMLDLFEECAHTYDSEPMHGGKNALDCMKILHNLIMVGDEEDGGTFSATPAKNAKGETLSENISKAISTLAHHLYHDAEEFCGCASDTNKETPMCSSFMNFKTLLYEAVDACKSLDAIDCAAWEEFYTPCKKNLVQMYDKVDFGSSDQCNYVKTSCGGAGPFPAFRRLDCGGEIAKPAWDFHTMYERGCLGASSYSSSSNVDPTPSAPTPSTPSSPSGTSPSSSTTEKKQYNPYNANGASDEKKPYSPTYSSSDPEPDSDSTSKSEHKKKKHHFFRNTFFLMVLASVGYITYKKRRENFDYNRFRQLREARNYAGGMNSGGGVGEYTGVSLSDSCSFEPPTLPPTPSATMI
mmetsp:Transcript_39466/g.72297  ORF Transcript_39466/g.72297 Transcript_39466/m.72297 type:complete len:963 (+) Transcript_39466:182-3070(+)